MSVTRRGQWQRMQTSPFAAIPGGAPSPRYISFCSVFHSFFTFYSVTLTYQCKNSLCVTFLMKCNFCRNIRLLHSLQNLRHESNTLISDSGEIFRTKKLLKVKEPLWQASSKLWSTVTHHFFAEILDKHFISFVLPANVSAGCADTVINSRR